MAGLNRVILAGRLGRDPEVRSLQNGGRVVSFSVATSESWTQDGERKELVEWSNVVIFHEKQGEIAEKYLRKGSEVLLEGKLQTRKWTDKEGRERYVTEVVLPKFGGSLTLIGGKPNGVESSSSGDRAAPVRESAAAGPGSRPMNHIEDSEVPW